MASEPKRLVRFSPRSDRDLTENYDYTTQQRGQAQAERYLDFLLNTAQDAADGKIPSRRSEDDPEVLVAFAKWPKATYGHYIVFTEEPGGIYVLRVLHGAMDMNAHLVEQRTGQKDEEEWRSPMFQSFPRSPEPPKPLR